MGPGRKISRGRLGAIHLLTRCIAALQFVVVANIGSSSSITKDQTTDANLVGPLRDELNRRESAVQKSRDGVHALAKLNSTPKCHHIQVLCNKLSVFSCSTWFTYLELASGGISSKTSRNHRFRALGWTPSCCKLLIMSYSALLSWFTFPANIDASPSKQSSIAVLQRDTPFQNITWGRHEWTANQY